MMNRSILLVDDDRDSCEMMAKLLQALGFSADMAHDGPSALKLLESNPYRVAIIDYHMPGMNGVDLFRLMRKAQPDLAGIFLTGFTTIDVVYPAVEAGVLRVLAKPADFQELVPIIEEHLQSVA